MATSIPFNRAHLAGKELYYIAQAVQAGELKGDGPYSQRCHCFLEERFGVARALLTHSCTGALELAALLLNIAPGDEVILPSYTFVSTANAFLLRGAQPRFVDIRPDTLNMDESQVEDAVKTRTRAIVPVHYAGVGCEMDTLLEIAARHRIAVVEDAAHAILARYRGRYLGTIGSIGAFSFHETKNYSCGEGGALLLADRSLVDRAEILREKGTDRSRFFRGEIARYTWVDIGSSYLPSELVAAYLYAQFERADEINALRLSLWRSYREHLRELEERGDIHLPFVPRWCEPNGHMFYILVESAEVRARLIAHLENRGVSAVFHYIPLHLSPMGERFGYTPGMFPVTERIGETILRLPLFPDLGDEELQTICDGVISFYGT